MIITINGTLSDLNAHEKAARAHFSKAAKIKKMETHRVAWECKKHPIAPITNFPVDITFTWYCENKKKDKDNISFAKKYILDGMVMAGVLPNDTWEYIGNFSDIFIIDKDNPRIEISVL